MSKSDNPEAIEMLRGVLYEMKQMISYHETQGAKMAAFHACVLGLFHRLQCVDAKEFCEAVGVPASYAIEYRKMLALRKFYIDNSLVLGEQVHLGYPLDDVL